MAANSSLPSGWEMSTDPNSGRSFYINHNTMQTSWTPPVEAPLTDGWEQMRDAEGRIFFINHDTHITQWDDPRLGFSAGATPDHGSGGTIAYPSLSDEVSSSIGGANSNTNNDGWNCKACTFLNSTDSATCLICEAAREGDPTSSFISSGVDAASNTPAYSALEDDSVDAETAAKIRAAQLEDDPNNKIDSTPITEPYQLSPYMVPDDHSPICTLCGKSFDWKIRRHHCKCCGSLLCNDCSSRKSRFVISGTEEVSQRVCDLCFDHQSAGDENCYVRYVGILRDSTPNENREGDYIFALKGIANMLDKLPEAMQDDASIDNQARALRTIDVVQRCGGAATLFDMLRLNADENVQVEACRIIASVASVATASKAGSEMTLSLVSVCNELSHGSRSMKAIKSSLLNSKAPWEAHMYIAKTLYLLGDVHDIKEAVRSEKMLPLLCDSLLAPQESLQSWSIMAISRLVTGNLSNVEEVLNTNGIQSLVLLLSADNATAREYSAAALCSILGIEELNDRKSTVLVSNVRDVMVQCGGATAAVALLSSEISSVARSGLRLIQYLSNGQSEVIRAAGAVPLVVGFLASDNKECHESATNALRNVAVGNASGAQDVLECGGLSLVIPLLSSSDKETRAGAVALCECLAGDKRGTQILLERRAIPTIVELTRDSVREIQCSAASILVKALQLDDSTGAVKQLVVNSGGVEALLDLESSTDTEVRIQLVRAVYSFVTDPQLFDLLTKRISPPSMSIKLLQMLHSSNLNDETIEMILLIVAVMCGAKEGDLLGVNNEVDEINSNLYRHTESNQEQQTRDLVASNGTPMILPLLGSGSTRPAVVLASLRLLLAVSKSATGAANVTRVNGVSAVVDALDDSLCVEGQTVEGSALVSQMRLCCLTLFGQLCGGGGNFSKLGNSKADDVRHGVRAISRVLEHSSGSDKNGSTIQLAAIRALKNLSFHSGNWDVIASDALHKLIEILLGDRDAHGRALLLTDVAIIVSNLSKLEKHSEQVLDAGAVFAFLNLLSENDSEAITAGLGVLISLAESSKRCRAAMVEHGAVSKLLHLSEQRLPPVSTNAIECLLSLSQDAASGPKITAEPGATESLLRLLRSGDSNLAELALQVLLAVAKNSEDLWEKLVVNADLDSCVALLRLGPSNVQAQAASTIAVLCGDSPGHALCSSEIIIGVIPLLVSLLKPPEHVGAEISESPAKEVAATCGLLSQATSSRKALIDAEVIPALVTLLLRERRLGRPRSATSEHTLLALYSFCKNDEGGLENTSERNDLWISCKDIGKRRDALDAVVAVLDAHVRDLSTPPSGCSRFDICEFAIRILGSLPCDLSPNEISIFGRSARVLNLIIGDRTVPYSLVNACVHTLIRASKESLLTSVLVAAGTIGSTSLLLEPLTEENPENLRGNVALEAAILVASIVSKSATNKSIDDAIIGSNTIPALAALITRTSELFPSKEQAIRALSVGLEAIACLAKGGVSIQKAIMASSNKVHIALALVVSMFDERNTEVPIDGMPTDTNIHRATHALLTLSRLASLDEHRILIVQSVPNILQLCLRILNEVDPVHETDNDECTAEVLMIVTTTQLICDLGPTVVENVPEICGPLVDNVVMKPSLKQAFEPALFALDSLANDQKCAEIILTEHSKIFTALARLFESSEDLGYAQDQPSQEKLQRHRCAAMSVVASLSASPRARQDEGVTCSCIKLCTLALTFTESKNLLTPINAALICNTLLVLKNLMTSMYSRKELRKSQVVVEIIKLIGTSSESEVYASYLAAKVVAALGTGEKIIRKNPPVTSVSASAVAMLSRKLSQSDFPSTSAEIPNSTNSNFFTKSPESIQIPQRPAPSLEKDLPTLPPSNSILPTYSNTVGSSAFHISKPSRTRGNMDSFNQMSLSQVRNLPTQNRIGAPQTAPIPPSQDTVWNCSACTFENKSIELECSMCETARPSEISSTINVNPPSYTSGSRGLHVGHVLVRCPSCATSLSCKGDAHVFECMKCHVRSTTAQNRVI